MQDVGIEPGSLAYKADELTTKPYRGYSKLMIYRFWIANIAWRGRKLLDLAEIWETCSLGKCLGIFLHFLKLLIFRPCELVFGPKMDRKCVFYRPVSNSGSTNRIMLKLRTMIDIDNSVCLKMKIFVYCVFYRPELQKCVFYRPVKNSGSTSWL